MRSEKGFSCHMSRCAILGVLILGMALVCMPVRGQEGKTAETVGAAAPTATSETDSIDPKVRKLAEATEERLSAYSDAATLTLKDGETGRMKVKKNLTSVAEILITPHFETSGVNFAVEGVDANGAPVMGVRTESTTVREYASLAMSQVLPIIVDGRNVMFGMTLTFSRSDDGRVVADVKVLFALSPTAEEREAMRLTRKAPVKPDLRKLGEAARKRWSTYSDVETLTLKDGETGRMKIKNNITPVAEILVTPHVEAGGTRFDLEGVDAEGKPVAGVRIASKAVPNSVVHTTSTGLLNLVAGKRLWFKVQLTPWSQDDGRVIAEVKVVFTSPPTPKEMAAMRLTKPKPSVGQRPRLSIYGTRPTGNCSIGGRVVSAETGEPLSQARVQLHYFGTESSMFVQVGSDGTFLLKDIPQGPFSLHTSNTAGYQDVVYKPDPVSVAQPGFSLADGEQRLDILLKAEPAYRISGKIRDPRGAAPEDLQGFHVLAWSQKDGQYRCEYGLVNRTHGSYVIDGLDNLPVYVMVVDRRAREEGLFPPVYYPSTFSRNKAEQIVFGDKRSIEDIDITLRTEGGLTLEGTVVDEKGNPVPEVFVVVHRSDMDSDYLTAYTDQRGQYRVEGLGDGQFRAHLDAAHLGYVRARTLVDLDGDTKQATCDVTLTKGALISGKLVDQAGSDWEIGHSYGDAAIVGKEDETASFFGGLVNKYGPVNVGEMSGSVIQRGEGAYEIGKMIFPTKSTFVIQGMMPGHTRLDFYPKAKNQEVLEIQYKGKNILESGLITTPGETIEDVSIVIGKK